MMSDFVELLRSYDEGAEPADGWWVAYKDLQKAADEIERLRSELAERDEEVTRLKRIADDNFKECVEARNLYGELLYEVATKFPNESRHETAKRYIHEYENQSSGGPSSKSDSV